MKSRVKELRTNLNITQESLAYLCQVSIPTIKRLENNESFLVQIQLLGKLAKALGCRLDDLFTDDSD